MAEIKTFPIFRHLRAEPIADCQQPLVRQRIPACIAHWPGAEESDFELAVLRRCVTTTGAASENDTGREQPRHRHASHRAQL